MMRTARCAALRGLSRPTAATGTPGGIWTTLSSESSPPAALSDDVSGTPITGRSVWAAATPGSAALRPGAGDDHLQPALARVAAVLGDPLGVAVGRHDLDLEGDLGLLEHLAGLLHGLQVGLASP